MHYNILKNMLYVNLLINQVQDLSMKMFDGLLQYQPYGNNQLNNLCEKLPIKFVLDLIFFKKQKTTFGNLFRLVLHHVNFLNNYLLLWNPKQHRYLYVNYECINLFLMKLQHFLVIQHDVIMDYFHLHYLIIHRLFYLIQKNVRKTKSNDFYLFFVYSIN